jgi:cytidine deaminase
VDKEELIRHAVNVLNPVMVGDRLFGDVGAALVTDSGNVYTGVCIDTGSWGLCAERSAIAAMVTAREYRIQRIVAVWREWRNGIGPLHVVSPCGVCREFIQQVDPANADTEVILGPKRTAKLRDLLPHASSYEPIEG